MNTIKCHTHPAKVLSYDHVGLWLRILDTVTGEVKNLHVASWWSDVPKKIPSPGETVELVYSSVNPENLIAGRPCPLLTNAERSRLVYLLDAVRLLIREDRVQEVPGLCDMIRKDTASDLYRMYIQGIREAKDMKAMEAWVRDQLR